MEKRLLYKFFTNFVWRFMSIVASFPKHSVCLGVGCRNFYCINFTWSIPSQDFEWFQVYYVSNASLKPANQQFNNTSHDYEMTLRRDSQIALCDSADVGDVPKVQYNFKKIKDLEQNVNGLVGMKSFKYFFLILFYLCAWLG